MAQLSVEEFKEITELRTKLSTIVYESGQQTLQISLLKADIKELETKIEENSVVFKSLLSDEQKIVNGLSEKYGAGSINFETGEFTAEK